MIWGVPSRHVRRMMREMRVTFDCGSPLRDVSNEDDSCREMERGQKDRAESNLPLLAQRVHPSAVAADDKALTGTRRPAPRGWRVGRHECARWMGMEVGLEVGKGDGVLGGQDWRACDNSGCRVVSGDEMREVRIEESRCFFRRYALLGNREMRSWRLLEVGVGVAMLPPSLSRQL